MLECYLGTVEYFFELHSIGVDAHPLNNKRHMSTCEKTKMVNLEIDKVFITHLVN